MNRFTNILYVTEAANDQAAAMERAVSLAANNRARLTVIDVIPPVREDLRKETVAYHMQALKSLVEPHRSLSIQVEVMMGQTFLEVIRAVLRNGYDLVVKPAENPSFLNRLFGSVDMHLLRKCPCPVWLMKQPEKSRYDCILAAVDFNPRQSDDAELALNGKILELAGLFALSDQASLYLVHAWEDVAGNILRRWGEKFDEEIAAHSGRERHLHEIGLSRLEAMLCDRIGSDACRHLSPILQLLQGPPQRVIAALAGDLPADLVIMGTVARTGIAGLFIGNTAEAILEQLSCSVLAVKPPGFATPVTLDE